MKLNLTFWSSLSFLFPTLLALYFRFYLYAIIVFLVLVFSLIIHFRKKSKKDFMSILDVGFAYVLITFNTYLFANSVNILKYFLMAFSIAIVAIIFYRKKDNFEINHSIWHILSAAICIITLVATY